MDNSSSNNTDFSYIQKLWRSVCSPELRIIGRCVSFCSEVTVGGQRHAALYVGTVSFVTHSTVTLMDVFRFSADTLLQRVNFNKSASILDNFEKHYHFATFFRKKISKVSFLDTQPICGIHLGRNIEEEPFLPQKLFKTLDSEVQINEPIATDQSVSSKLISSPLQISPYAYRDIEWCKMLVRRYIVHNTHEESLDTSAISLFISKSGIWPSPNLSLLAQIAYEELSRLAAVEEEITRHGKKACTRVIEIADIGTMSHTNRLRNGISIQTVSTTRLSVNYSYFAILHVTLSIGQCLYLVSVFPSLERSIIAPFLYSVVIMISISAMLQIVSGISSAAQSLQQGRLGISSFSRTHRVIINVTLLFSLFTFIHILFMFVKFRNFIIGKDLYNHWISSSKNSMCSFMTSYQCSGFHKTCQWRNVYDNDCVADCAASEEFLRPCGSFVKKEVHKTLLLTIMINSAQLILLLADDIHLLYSYGTLVSRNN